MMTDTEAQAVIRRVLADRSAVLSGPRHPTADPTHPPSTLRASFALMQAGDWDAAERLLGWALAFTPNDARLLRRMSDVVLRRGDRAAAFDWVARAISADPEDAFAHNSLAWLHLSQGDLAAAETAMRRAVALAPGNAAMLRRMSEIRMRRGDGAPCAETAAVASSNAAG